MDQGEALLDPRHTRDLRGMVFGRLRVVRFAGYRMEANGKRAACWWTVCSCGSDREYDFTATTLLSGNTKSHGCLKGDVHRARHEAVRQGYIGKRQNDPNSRLAVIGIEEVGTAGKQTILRCICHGPGEDHPKVALVQLSDFISLHVLSCGCLWNEVRVAATRRRHANYRELHGFERNQLMGDVNKALRRTMKPLSFQVILRDGKKCLLCGTANYLEAHHCVPIHENRGRAADPFNLVALCESCHRKRAHAGNIRGPVDPVIAEHLQRLAALNEAACPTELAIDLESIQRQVVTLFGYRDNKGRLNRLSR